MQGWHSKMFCGEGQPIRKRWEELKLLISGNETKCMIQKDYSELSITPNRLLVHLTSKNWKRPFGVTYDENKEKDHHRSAKYSKPMEYLFGVS